MSDSITSPLAERFPDGSFRGVAVCPTCGARRDAHAALSGDRAPRAGDVSVCGECAAVAIYTGEPLRPVREPTAIELRALLEDPEIRAAVAACHAGEWRRAR